ncbi:MAG TPA: hypothetical protein VEB59_14505 [Gemmatimonadales bacterium]|nr:hypothetical protein [Gemmatimonadales bacterium]
MSLLLTIAAGLGGYILARNFVIRRLRFVDAAQSRFAPFTAGLVGTLLLAPLALLPTVTLWTAVVFGIGAAFGTSRGGRIIRRADWELRRIAP